MTVLAVLLVTPALAAAQSSDTATIRNMVDQWISYQWISYWNASDVEGITSLYVDDAVGMGPELDNVGREAMRQGFQSGFQLYSGTQSATVDEVQVDGALAFTRGTWRV